MTGPAQTPEAWVLHVDLDQFLAAVEVLRHPELAGRPVIVGGRGDPTERAVVSTASYEARAFGVRSGMSLRIAVRKCPEAVLLPVDHETYEAISAEVMNTLREFTDPPLVVEVMGWDEAFLGAATEDPEALALRIRQAVLAATQLSCSIGIGENTLQAKMATGYAKPAGVFRLTRANWLPLLGDESTDALWGIGRKTASKLAAIGISTVAELSRTDPAELAARFGPKTGPWFAAMGRGIARSEITGEEWVPRSRSRETTYQQNLETWPAIRAATATLAEQVASDIAVDGREIMRIAVKVRFAPFFTQLKSHKLASPTRDSDALVEAALELLEKFDHERPVRLLGFRAEFTI